MIIGCCPTLARFDAAAIEAETVTEIAYPRHQHCYLTIRGKNKRLQAICNKILSTHTVNCSFCVQLELLIVLVVGYSANFHIRSTFAQQSTHTNANAANELEQLDKQSPIFRQQFSWKPIKLLANTATIYAIR